MHYFICFCMGLASILSSGQGFACGANEKNHKLSKGEWEEFKRQYISTGKPVQIRKQHAAKAPPEGAIMESEGGLERDTPSSPK